MEGVLIALPAIGLVAFANWMFGLAVAVRERNLNGVASRVLAWVFALASVWIFAQTTWAADVPITMSDGEATLTLALLSFVELIVLAAGIAATAGLVADAKRAVNNADPKVDATLLPKTGARPPGQ